MWHQDHLLKGKRHRFYKNLEWGMRPYEKQQEVVDYLWGHRRNSKNGLYKFFLAVFGRQSGKSFLGKYVALRRAIEFSHKVMWVAPTSKNMRSHWNELKQLILDAGIPYVKISEVDKEISFHGGGFIRVRSALEGDGLRGGTMDLIILDEAAFYENGKSVYYSIILPMVTASGGQILFTTTPNGRNYVYDLFQLGLNKSDDLHISWHMKSMDSPYQDKEVLKAIKRTMPNMQWREEFEAEFLSDSGGVFAGVDRASVVPMQTEPVPNGIYSMGVDWGDIKDFTCVTIINTLTGEQVFGTRFTGIGTKYQLERIINLMYHWQPDHVYVERNGMGQTYYKLLVETVQNKIPLDELINSIDDSDLLDNAFNDKFEWWDTSKEFGKKIMIHGVHVDNRNKREMVESAASHIEYGRLRLLAEGENVQDYGNVQKSELSTFERKRTAIGNVTYGASDENHDDTVSALILAARGLPKPQMIDKQASKKASDIKQSNKNPFRQKSKSRIANRR